MGITIMELPITSSCTNRRLKTIINTLNILINDNDKSKYLCVFDLDGCLTDYNTTYDFIGFLLLRKNLLRYTLYIFSLSLFSIVIALMQKLFRTNIDLNKLFALEFIRGVPRKFMNQIAKDYSRRLSRYIKIKRTFPFELLEECKSGYKVFVVSKTLDPLRYIENYIGVKVYTSKIRYSKSSKVASLEYDINKKLLVEILLKKLQINPLLIVSDDPNDMFDIFPVKILVKNRQSAKCPTLNLKFLGRIVEC
jgi:phosphoserine phosphatase